VDGVVIAGSATFAGALSWVLSTGEISNRPVGRSDNLLVIDRAAVTQTIDPHAAARSNVGVYAAVAYAILDPILAGVRDGRRALVVDLVLYAEALALSQAFVQGAKAAVRRPRPIDHIRCADELATATDCSDPDLQLSFFSAHTATMSAITGVATYLAFVRAPASSLRPWITLAAGTALTAFVGYERVRSGQHFPSDVIVGAVAGAGIGVLVPHLHRRTRVPEHAAELPLVVVGYAPIAHGGGVVNLQLRF
jgi:membrane-associated phospholipid phosphatase